MAILPVGISAEEGGYQIERSLRFNSADSAYLSWTPASAGNRKTWTWSGWVKRGVLGTQQPIFSAGTATTDKLVLRFQTTDVITVQSGNGGSIGNISTSAVYRDTSAWYHIVLSLDAANTTASIYVNGVQQSITTTTTFSNTDHQVNSTNAHSIGGATVTDLSYRFDGYLADVHFIDGSALTPSSFGEFDSDTGVWKPKAYSGSYGTNGFYLDFADNSSTTALGYDAAGSNDWTPNNFSVTAGAGNDSLVDSPTRYGTDTGAGGEVRGNYATLNPLAHPGQYTAITNGNLTGQTLTANPTNIAATIGVSNGKWYWETTFDAQSSDENPLMVGVAKEGAISTARFWESSNGHAYYGDNGNYYTNGSDSAYGAAFTIGDIVGAALDLDAGTLTMYKNGVSQGTMVSGLSGTYIPYWSDGSATRNATFTFNAGQRPFAYTAPSGFKALCTTNLPDPIIADGSTAFNVVTWSGAGASSGSVTGVGFQPDFVWSKVRSTAYSHVLYDVARGTGKSLLTDTTLAEISNDPNGYISSFDSDGFSSLSGGTNYYFNQSGQTYVAWNWKANGAGVSNTDGTITSTVSANTTAGFSIVTYTGNATGGATVGHGLGATPSMIIIKQRDTTKNWFVYHTSIGNTGYIMLNLTDAQDKPNSTMWNNSGPSSTTFTIGSSNGVNTSGGTYVAYCFAPIAGYSAFGSYVGSGSADGSFVFLGLRPRYLLVKRTDSTSGWGIYDSEREPYNLNDTRLLANTSGADDTSTDNGIDFLSNGIKWRTASGWNASGATYIYAAFAENPFKFSLAR